MLPLARHLSTVVPEEASMCCRSDVGTLMALLAVMAACGCASRSSSHSQPILDPRPTINSSLISPSPQDGFTDASPEFDPQELAWVQSRNDALPRPAQNIPEVADPGSYWVVTRDYQRTINGRPWNFWSSQTWIRQRGSGR
jgi:hypothetical protein